MSQDTENFEQLRRLLKLKRYEQPPPRYFNEFSSRVIARIERGEQGDRNTLAGRMLWEAPWLHRIWAALEAKPLMTGAFGLAVCATLITGVIRSEGTDLQAVAVIPGTESPISSPVEFANAVSEDRAVAINAAITSEAFSTNPIPALFLDLPQNLRADPASLTLPGRN
jgi:hypothetical protein